MMSFRDGRLPKLALPQGSVWLLTDIAEAKGRQGFYTKQAPQLLRALREMALVQSVESSNRIEGVTVAPGRLRPLVIGSARPRDRSEEDIHGYRQALNVIHTGARDLAIAPDLLKRLHRIAQEAAGDAGQWKRVENEIVELRQGRAPLVRFRPVSVADTPAAVEELCTPYRHATTPESLRRSSEGWYDGRHDLLPWLNYFLGVIRRAYREFEERTGQVKTPRGAKTALVAAAVEGFHGGFTLAQLERACPGVSRDMVRRVLRDFQRAGRVVCLGRGPGASWRRKGTTSSKG